MKSLVKIMSVIMVMVLIIGCSSKKEDEKVVKLGIIQYVEHTSLNTIRESIINELKKQGYEEGKNLEINYQNGQGDQANLKTISTKLAKESDIVVAIATPAAQSIANETKDTPIVFSAITEPLSAGLVKTMEKPGGNVTGVSDGINVEKQIELIKKVNKDTKTVGMLYNPSEANSSFQIKEAKAAIEAMGMKTEVASVSTTNDVKQAITSLVKKSDVVYVPIDNTVASSMAAVGDVAKANGVPTVCAADSLAQDGGLVSYGVNYEKLGIQTANMVLEVLKDPENIGNIPVETVKDLEVYVNEDVAKELKIDPNSLK